MLKGSLLLKGRRCVSVTVWQSGGMSPQGENMTEPRLEQQFLSTIDLYKSKTYDYFRCSLPRRKKTNAIIRLNLL